MSSDGGTSSVDTRGVDGTSSDGGTRGDGGADRRSESPETFGITAAAERAGVGEQTLRLYESKGLFRPIRTAGGTRRYSESDLEVVRRAVALMASGVNLAGVAVVIRLQDDNARLHARATAAERRLRRRSEGQTEPSTGTPL
ncbi:MAG: MerR family transcriptional regulator [Microbacteriaceae bacterium]|nr:MerR family transcriptional regulator [Microbacteriaceae bacterium]